MVNQTFISKPKPNNNTKIRAESAICFKKGQADAMGFY
jgi:hypothetical protein